MEYDVDFAGRWDDLFAPFADNDADLLTTLADVPHAVPGLDALAEGDRAAVGPRGPDGPRRCTR